MSSIVALDIGERRIGVAVASQITKLPHPHSTLDNTMTVWNDIRDLMKEYAADTLVVGLPRNLSGDDTAQTTYVRNFVAQAPDLHIVFQDEALTSRKAEAELISRGKPYVKGDIDALAATYILEDYLHTEGSIK